ncbi:MAG: hypothetical protein DHS20C18_37960 [Saprospiraceae bacterium]|nr:MAG: hypothetical protein DHS20C18_37960 [Saprospiraceae bacterium]
MKKSIHKAKERTRQKLFDLIRPELEKVEDNRKNLYRAYITRLYIVFFLAISIILVLILVALFMMSSDPLGVVLIPLIAAYLLIAWLNKLKPDAEEEITKSIGEIVIKTAHPEWDYFSDQCLAEENFDDLDLAHSLSLMDGENLIAGKYKETAFHISYYRPSKHNNKEKQVETKLVLVFDFHKEVTGKTVVFPDFAQQLLGTWLGKEVQELGWHGLELVYFEDHTFEKHYAVYSSDQIEARYILTPSMMEGLVTMKAKYGYDFSFSFTGGKVCVAISGLPDYRNKLKDRVTPDGAYQNFYRPIEIAIDVIETMNLNTRIWSKE